MRGPTKKAVAGLLAMLWCAVCFGGCSGAASWTDPAGTAGPARDSSRPAASQPVTPDPDVAESNESDASAESAGSDAGDTWNIADIAASAAASAAAAAGARPAGSEKDATDSAAVDSAAADSTTTDSTAAEKAPAPAFDSIEGVARLGELVGNYAMEMFAQQISGFVVVDTENAHNPYDLTWRYGAEPQEFVWLADGSVDYISRDEREQAVADPDWDALYRSYVEACDWSLVFDATYYKNTFPMLAKLYHDDDALLLEHFQTQGVHEGRQASAAFNVAAYMQRCDPALTEAFGDDYVCYYFYYMLHPDEQRAGKGAGGGDFPSWLTVQLSLQQAREFAGVNKYRAAAGVEPVALHPEMMAFASYRAWHDAEYNYYAHDWCTDPSRADDVSDCFDRLRIPKLSENTVKWYHKYSCGGFQNFVENYANSPPHYEAMVRADQKWMGCSNPYWSDNPENVSEESRETGYCAQFDVFCAEEPTAPGDTYD